jgi:hypothetical protein
MTRADIELATPRCLRTIVSGKTKQHGIHRPCWQLMKWHETHWHCRCGNVEAGTLAAARRLAAL